MADPRKVGHAIRRRMGAESSHLGMAQRAARENGYWNPPGPQPGQVGTDPSLSGGAPATGGRLKGVPDAYDTGTDTYGRGAKPPIGDSSAFVSGVSAGVVQEPHPSRIRMSQDEAASARLTVSPSMKMPQESPVPTQGGGHVVPSTTSRQGSFQMGQAGAYQG